MATDLNDQDNWKPNPGVQELFLSCPADEVFYGGAAGGGKTDALLVDSLRGVGTGGYKALLLRKTFPELEKSIIQRSREIIPRLTKGRSRYDSINHKWVFPNQDVLQFGHCKTHQDAQKYQSAEYHYIGFDELTHFEENTYLFLFSRLRTRRKEIKCYMRAASNPGGIGHNWVKKRFIDTLPPCEIGFFRKQKDVDTRVTGTDPLAISRCWIPAGVKDNPKIDKSYLAMLHQLPETLKRAMLFGDWNVFVGQYFKEFDYAAHVTAPFEIPDHWMKYIVFDPGYNDPCCALWIAVSPSGHHFCYREYYASKVLSKDQAKIIKELTGHEKIETFIAGRDLWNKYATGGIAAVGSFNDEGLYPIRANTDRVQGWHRVHQMLALMRDDKPKCMIFNTCDNLIRTLPALVHSDNKPEDVSNKQEDHAPDAFRYYAISSLVADDIPEEPKQREGVIQQVRRIGPPVESEEMVWDSSTGYLA